MFASMFESITDCITFIIIFMKNIYSTSTLLKYLIFRENTQQKRKNKENQFYLRCTACYEIAATLEELELHYLSHDRKYDCPQCQEKFRCLYHCSLHTSEHYGKNFICCLCKKKCQCRTSLLIHINTVHLKRYLFYCNKCGKGFNNKQVKIGHEDWHKNDERYVCIVCQKKYCDSTQLIGHQRRTHNVTIPGAENSCAICKKAFRKKSALESHIRTVHQKSVCDICGKSFYNVDGLRLHIRVHTGFKPYACITCDKRFIRKQLLDIHIRTHTGEKPYACEHCGKRFSQRTPLRIHTRLHTGEKPYVCRFCSKGYMSKGGLSVHMKRCTGGTPQNKEMKVDDSDENDSDA